VAAAGTQAAGAPDEHRGAEQAPLGILAEAVEHHLARIALHEIIG